MARCTGEYAKDTTCAFKLSKHGFSWNDLRTTFRECKGGSDSSRKVGEGMVTKGDQTHFVSIRADIE
jgi:hypothetical protein